MRNELNTVGHDYCLLRRLEVCNGDYTCQQAGGSGGSGWVRIALWLRCLSSFYRVSTERDVPPRKWIGLEAVHAGMKSTGYQVGFHTADARRVTLAHCFSGRKCLNVRFVMNESTTPSVEYLST